MCGCNERLGLSGKLDLLITSSQGRYPVDFKYSRSHAQRTHEFLLAGYALLVEEAYETQVDTAFLYMIPLDEIVPVSITDSLKQEALGRLAEIRRMIDEAILPPPTPVRARCEECEFRNYCGDIF